jgi:hypothetical protein
MTLTGPSTYSGPLPNAQPPAWIEVTNRVLPAIDGFDEELTLVSVLAAEVIDEPQSPPATLGDIVDLTSQVDDGMLVWDVPAGPHRVFAIYENQTLHFPAGGASKPVSRVGQLSNIEMSGRGSVQEGWEPAFDGGRRASAAGWQTHGLRAVLS